MARMVARIRRLPTPEALRRREVARELLAHFHGLPDKEMDPKLRQVFRALRTEARNDDEPLWPGGYDMFSRRQMEHIRKELRKLSGKDRRQDVYDAFLMLIGNIDRDTGEITLSRKDFADELGIALRHVSSVMTTLERLNVVRREYEGTRVTYFVNANIAWNGDLDLRKTEAAKSVVPSEKAAQDEAPAAPGPLLKLMQGGLAGKPDQADQAAPKPRPGGGRSGRKKAGA